jgi:hypothetical protein
VAVTTTWRVEVGYYDNGTAFTTTDFTDRTLGLTVDHFTDVGIIGTGQAVITLDNNDGALTPQAGGTYSSTNWFERALLIYCDVAGGGSGSVAKVFAGIIDSFEVEDDGVTSTVTIAAVDVLQTASRQQVQTLATFTATSPFFALRTIVDPSEVYNDTVMPNFGETAKPDGDVSVYLLSPSVTRQVKVLTANISAGPIGDYLSNHVVTCGLTAVWPGAFDTNTGHQEIYVVENAQRTNATTFQFAESPTGAEMPYRNLERGFQLDQLTTAARIQRLDTGYLKDLTASQARFGSRLREYITASDSDADTNDDVFNWLLRFAEPRYTSTRLQITAGMIEANLPDAQFLQWLNLLTVANSIWAGASIEFTPAGRPSAITDFSVIIGRTIKASPADTTVTLTLRPSIDYGTFTLDSPALGIIGINRLG